MKMLGVLIGSLVLSTGVNAFDLCEYSDPPDRYEYVPNVPVKLHVVKDMDTIREVCELSATFNAWGCHIEHHKTGEHEIYVLDTGNVEEMNCILMHEYAHVNGWPKHHPY